MLGSFDERTKSCPSKFFSETRLTKCDYPAVDLRKSIEDEKIPLASEIGKLEREARKKIEVDRLNRIRDNRDANLIQLKEEVKKEITKLNSFVESWQIIPEVGQKLRLRQKDPF